MFLKDHFDQSKQGILWDPQEDMADQHITENRFSSKSMSKSTEKTTQRSNTLAFQTWGLRPNRHMASGAPRPMPPPPQEPRHMGTIQIHLNPHGGWPFTWPRMAGLGKAAMGLFSEAGMRTRRNAWTFLNLCVHSICY
jgi:hypothetical protein